MQAFENRLTITGVLSIMLVGGAIWLTVNGESVPDWMLIAIATIMGYFFGGSGAPKQFRQDDAERIQSALYETLPPHTKMKELEEQYKRERSKRND
jgi:hypothetical protein